MCSVHWTGPAVEVAVCVLGLRKLGEATFPYTGEEKRSNPCGAGQPQSWAFPGAPCAQPLRAGSGVPCLADVESSLRVTHCRQILRSLPEHNYAVLRYLVAFLHTVSGWGPPAGLGSHLRDATSGQQSAGAVGTPLSRSPGPRAWVLQQSKERTGPPSALSPQPSAWPHDLDIPWPFSASVPPRVMNSSS